MHQDGTSMPGATAPGKYPVNPTWLESGTKRPIQENEEEEEANIEVCQNHANRTIKAEAY